MVTTVSGQGRLLSPPSRLSMWRQGYITARYEDDASSGCIMDGGGDMCPVCGHSANVTGDVVRTFTQASLIEVVLEFTEANITSSNILRLCPAKSKIIIFF